MLNQEKIDKIYEVIADKTLSFGCKVDDKFSSWIGRIIRSYQDGSVDIYRDNKFWFKDVRYLLRNQKTIIWHPVMIWDVLDWSEAKELKYTRDICYSWKDKRKPIEDQTDETIDFVYSLVKDV